MNQKYKIFINKKHVYIVNSPAQLDNINDISQYILLNYVKYNDIQVIIDQFVLNEENTNNIIIFDKNVEKLKNLFFDYFNVVEAAGGIVLNPKNEILLIYRRGSWDLPKGKIDDGESIENAALREIEEETGVKNLKIVKPIMLKESEGNITYHYYENDRIKCIKLTHWFVAKSSVEQSLVPQTEEDIEQVIWVDKKDLPTYYANMYGSIKDVLNSYISLHN